MTERMPQGKETVSDEDILAAMRSSDDPVVSATEIGDHFDHTRQWAHQRLEQLYEEGMVEKKEASKRSVVWWVKD